MQNIPRIFYHVLAVLARIFLGKDFFGARIFLDKMLRKKCGVYSLSSQSFESVFRVSFWCESGKSMPPVSVVLLFLWNLSILLLFFAIVFVYPFLLLFLSSFFSNIFSKCLLLIFKKKVQLIFSSHLFHFSFLTSFIPHFFYSPLLLLFLPSFTPPPFYSPPLSFLPSNHQRTEYKFRRVKQMTA